MRFRIIYTLISFMTFFSPMLYSQNCSQPSFCNRLCWSPTGSHPAQSNPTYTTPTHIIVHHSGESTVFPVGTNFSAVVRSYWDYHVNTNGWSDIAYNWLVDRNGVIYEGRGYGVLGAHFSCMNQNTMGVCVIGNFNLENPTTSALNSLRDLIAWESSVRNFCVTDNSYHSNSQLNLFRVSGHRDGNSSTVPWSCSGNTVCPGNNLYTQLTSIRSSVTNLSCYNECGATATPSCNNNLPCSPIPPTLTINTIGSCNPTSCSTINATATSPNITFYNGSNNNCTQLYQTARHDDDVWFRITPNSNNPITIRVTPTSNTSNFDPVVGLYQGSCSSPSQVACADVNGVGEVENLQYIPNSGAPYLIRVFSYGISSSNAGNFQICVFSSACNPPSQPGSITGNTTVCSSTSQNYSISSVSGATSYTWSYSGGGTPSGTGTSINFTPTNSGTLSVVANNSCGSSTARTLSITVNPTPTTQSSNLTFSNVGQTSMTVNWTNGNGSRRVVYINNTNSFNPPSNGTDPTANTSYSGSGQQCVFNGASSSVTVSGLSCGTTYYFRVYEANCTGSNSIYNTSVGNNTNIQITSSCSCPPPSNDNCSSSSALIVTSSASCSNTQATVACATSSGLGANNPVTTCGGCSGCSTSCGTNSSSTSSSDCDVFFRFQAVSTTHTVTVSSISFDAVLELRSGCGSGCANYIGSTDPSGSPSILCLTYNNFTPGTWYYIRVFRWSSSSGCSDPATPTFNICVTHTGCNPPPQPGTISGNTTVCSSTSQNYSISSVSGATSYTWSYSGGGTPSGTGTSINFTPTSSGTLSVVANNSCGSSTARTLSITVNPTPATQASNLTFSNVGQTSMTVNWTNGNGSRRVVYVNNTNSFYPPSNGTDPTANTSYSGSGQQCVFNGSGSSISVSGLTCGTTYYFRVYEANCTGSSSVYNSTVNNNTNNQATPACSGTCLACPSYDFTITPTTSWQIHNGSITSGGCKKYNVSMTAGNTYYFSTCTADGGSANYNTYFRLYNSTCNVVSSDDDYCNPQSYISFTPNSSGVYYFEVSGFSTSSGNYSLAYRYTTSSSCSVPLTQAGNITFSGIGTMGLTVNWTNGNGSRRVVFISTVNNFIASTNGADPTANTIYGGSGQQCIFNGSGNSVTVTGLTCGTDYFFRVYEANCTGSNAVYSTGTAANNPSSESTSACTCTTPSTQASSITYSSVGTTGMTVNWTNGNGSRRVVYINTVNNFTASPNGTDPIANNTYNGSGQQCIFNGSGTSSIVTGLTCGTNYFFRVYEANCTGSNAMYSTGSAANNPSSESTSACTCTTPSTQASSITYSGVGTAGMTVNWTNGNGSRRVVYINTVNNFTAPSNGINPIANNTYNGSGQHCIFNGSGNSVTVTGLTCGTNYFLRVYEANCTGSNVLYNTITAANNPSGQSTSSCTCTTPSTQASSITYSGVGTAGMTVNWTNGNGSRRVVYINTVNNFTAPSNGTDPIANNTYNGSGQQCIFNGSGTSSTVMGLTCGTNYFFRVYEANCTGSNAVYSTGSAANNPGSQSTSACTCTTPTTQASSITYSGVGTTGMTVNWTNGNGSRRVVYINTVNNFTAPSNGTNPIANNTYNGSGQQCIFNGSGNSGTVMGLTCGTNYFFRVYEANCTGSNAVYSTGTTANNPSSESTSACTCTTPTTQARSITYLGVGQTSMTVSWMSGNGSRRVVYINTTNNFTSPVNGTNPAANTYYNGSGQQCIFNGSGNSIAVTGLTCGTTYFFRVYEANCTGTSSIYYTVSAANNPSSEVTSGCITTNSFSSDNSTIVVYPNPTNDLIIIEGTSLKNDKYQISLYNLFGQRIDDHILNIQNGTIKYQLELGDFSGGIYFITIRSTTIHHTFKIFKY